MGKEGKNKTVLLSYPRSGNTWTRYCVEAITKKPTKGVPRASATIRKPMGELVPLLEVDLDAEFILYKHHFKPKGEIENLILLLRDPFEAIPRHKKITKFKKGDFQKYIDLLTFYDSFSKNKIIIYYENLLEKDELEKELKGILSFLNELEDHLPEFMDNLDWHREQAIQAYNTNGSPSQTKGKTKSFHKKKFSDLQKTLEEFKEFDSGKLLMKYAPQYLDIQNEE